jgi:hypothetical protein
LAAVEQHLEHLAKEHDWRSAVHVSTSSRSASGPQVVWALAWRPRYVREMIAGTRVQPMQEC